MKKVRHITAILTHYRVPIHEKARSVLQGQGIDYSVVYGQPSKSEASKGDLAHLPWGKRFHNCYLDREGRMAVWQPVLLEALNADLVIVSQENRLLTNYILQSLPGNRRPRIALWGHGRNFQARNPNSRSERWKRWWSTRCDWWFAYTEESSSVLKKNGFDPARITIFNNSIDVQTIETLSRTINEQTLEELKRDLGLIGASTCVYVGGIYADKRLDFLLECSDMIRAQVPEFELLIIGGGPELERITSLAVCRPWVYVLGPKFGRDKVELMMLSRLFLIPGLVGLAVLDAAALGLPVVTTAFPYHSPEIAYIDNGLSGVIVDEWESPAAYAGAVVELLRHGEKLGAMSEAARKMSEKFGIDQMAQRYCDGIVSALSAKRRNSFCVCRRSDGDKRIAEVYANEKRIRGLNADEPDAFNHDNEELSP